jgi:hypothetical protein
MIETRHMLRDDNDNNKLEHVDFIFAILYIE